MLPLNVVVKISMSTMKIDAVCIVILTKRSHGLSYPKSKVGQRLDTE